MATLWRRRQTWPHWLVVFLLAQLLRPCTSLIQSMSSVLEEVLEHGPLFDEMEDEAWWSGVDVIDTALRSSWPDAGFISDSALLAPGASSSMDDDDFCRFWQSNRMHPSSSSSSPSSLPAEACALMNRALAVDLSGGSGSLFLLPRLPPPPPVPPTLTELVKQLNQLGQVAQEQTTVGNDDNECLLCQWATLNGTIDLLPNSELSSENTWVPMLVVVALVSAMLGAVLMITALKCRRFKVLPRGGSCPTLPVGYMVGEGKEGVVQSNASELSGMETMPKSYTARQPAETNGTMTSTLGRPRLETPTMNVVTDSAGQPHPMQQLQKQTAKTKPSETATGWRVKLWRKMTGSGCNDSDYCQHPYGADESDDISAVYAELNSVAGSTVHRPSPIYHLNTYSEIREPHHVMMPPPPHPPHPQQPQTSSLAATLHLRRLLSDGTYENAGYALERGVILMEHDAVSSNCSASTPSSAYYSDLSHSDRSGSLHHQQLMQWAGGSQQCRPRPRVGSESHGSSHSLPPHQHCCHHHHHLHHHHQHSRSLQEQQMIRARDLMPVALQVIPDNQQTVPVLHYLADDVSASAASASAASAAAAAHHHQLLSAAFSRGGVSSSMRDDGSSGSCKRPLPPLPSRQQQRPQRRYAYAVDHQANSSSGNETPPHDTAGGGESPALSCVPSEYV
ncbi:uncharacterized protein LOC130694380 [Daphnia carinata]|uniref:uncharacterized protein LOC130694380 n=1 Tax=Daphnia carinata TaxID=120202 RepID=UPI00257F7EC7|nr:uncharacterized protein LOC130694380 [Daphnia carinata]